MRRNCIPIQVLLICNIVLFSYCRGVLTGILLKTLVQRNAKQYVETRNALHNNSIPDTKING